jgi:beta-mannosidase
MTRPSHHASLAGLGWTVRAVGDLSHVPAEVRRRVVPASVPGCIHTDLIDACVIHDPRIGDAEAASQWVSWTDWRYEAEFAVDERLLAHDEIDLAFDHLDTIGLIEINGVEVGRATSEFLPWRYPVREVVRAGKNSIAVTFTSPLRYVKEEAARLGARPVNGDYPAYNMIRKCASNFEWDWGPRVATCGIAGDVRLEGGAYARISHVTPRWMSPSRCRVAVGVQVSERGSRVPLELRANLFPASLNHGASIRALEPHSLAKGTAEWVLDIDSAPVEPWMPASHGGQHDQLLSVELHTPRGVAAEWKGRVGRRDVRFDETNATLAVNGQPVFCRGANWIPEGLFPRDRTPERVRQRLLQLKAANMNMVRVWGGGRYEPDWFYDICDELGIMVWQDFMFACACYPEEEPIRSLVEQEARYHVARLSRHPSVVLWCGGNECTWAHESWGFKEKLAPGQTSGKGYYDELLPRVCAEVNPSVPYIPNSPFSPTMGVHPNNTAEGDSHTWEVWGEGYRTTSPRFCSEFGQQGPSSIESLRDAGLLARSGGAELVPGLLAARQRGPGGNKRWYDDPIAAWFRPPRDFDEWHYLAQLLQTRSLAIGVEWHRASMGPGGCMGSLIWQLNDAWPGLSWSLIDPAGRPKLAYHAVRHAFRDLLLTIQPIDGELWLIAVNDSEKAWEQPVLVERVKFDGAVLAARRAPLKVPPRTMARVAAIAQLVGAPDSPAHEMVVAHAWLENQAHWFYLPDRDLEYPTPGYEWTTENDGGVLRAHTLIRDPVVVLCGRRGAKAYARPHDVQVLMPGGVYDIPLGGNAELDGGIERIDVLCANRFGKPAGA